ncbi:hypothetical protein WUBG_17628 [Wuchereria bancrofti]|uniref:Nematode cuticle collagen N-terminal domain-containing protein n=1 Tax=Wuchereria bancrofti TaxID=6293 RepID=J9ABU1_WUCBA|nr:hypothetical protein WUBG_17628 [Wuchereria bancrofti]
MGTQMLVNLTSIASGLVIIVSLIIVGVILQDINSFYYEVLDDMDEFKILANDAWDEIMSVHVSHNSAIAKKESITFLFACALQAINCPPGPTGPPGDVGLPGGNFK